MRISTVCILGGTGLVGRAIADHLADGAIRVRVVTRMEARANKLRVLPTVEVVEANPHDPAQLRECFDNVDAVINLVGILNEGRGRTFQSCHAELPRKVVEACHASGVQQLLHMSALGAAGDAPSAYLRSKAAGETAVRVSAAITPYTIFRPSVIFGEGDRFLGLFAHMVRWFPLIPLGGAQARFQPIWVEDVARCFVAALGNPQCFNQGYDLCGPKAYTLADLVRFVGATVGRRPRVLALPAPLARMQALVLEHLPGQLMSRDNLRSMSVDNVCAQRFPEVFGFHPSPLEAVVPEYLVGSVARARYPAYRHNAGR